MMSSLRVNLVVASMYVNRAEILAQPRSWDAGDWVVFSEHGLVIRCLVESSKERAFFLLMFRSKEINIRMDFEQPPRLEQYMS